VKGSLIHGIINSRFTASGSVGSMMPALMPLRVPVRIVIEAYEFT